MSSERCDILIIGGGPAGLSAGIYSVRRGFKTILLEKQMPGGRLVWAPMIENYPGFPDGLSGADLSALMVKQFEKLGGEIRSEEVISMQLKETQKVIATRERHYESNVLIIATGMERKRLLVPGEAEFIGRGVSYCALCDGPFFKGRNVIVIGSGEEAANELIMLNGIATKIYSVQESLDLEISKAVSTQNLDRVELLEGEVKAIKGSISVETVDVENKNGVKSIPVSGVFISVGYVPTTELIKAAGIEVDEKGSIRTDRVQRTNLSGVFAAGDCTGGGLQVATAVGEGAMAAISAFQALRKSR